MVDSQKICAQAFWDKLFTKKWLAENTSFKTPKTLLGPCEFNGLVAQIMTLPEGFYVLKNNKGRQSIGVFFFEILKSSVRASLIHEPCPTSEIFTAFRKIKRERRIDVGKDFASKMWFVEELISPHVRFAPFTDDLRFPPIIRLCGRPKIHFIGMSTMRDLETGLSGAHWQKRKYVWVDLNGVIRKSSDMRLDKTDRHSVNVVEKKSEQNAPFYSKIEGISEVVEQLNSEIVPKIQLFQDHTWSCDGIFNQNNEFVVLELNHSAGLRFEGFSW